MRSSEQLGLVGKSTISMYFFLLFPNVCNQVLTWRWIKDWQDLQHKIFKLVAQLNRSMGFLHTFWLGDFHSGSWNVWICVSEDNRCSTEGISVPTAFIFLAFGTLAICLKISRVFSGECLRVKATKTQDLASMRKISHVPDTLCKTDNTL